MAITRQSDAAPPTLATAGFSPSSAGLFYRIGVWGNVDNPSAYGRLLCVGLSCCLACLSCGAGALLANILLTNCLKLPSAR
jgi:hypothetical protein